MKYGFATTILVLLMSLLCLSSQVAGQANDVEVTAPGSETVKFSDLKDNQKTSGLVWTQNGEEWTKTGTWTRAQGQQNVKRFNLTGDPVQEFHELGNEQNGEGPVEDLDPNDPLKGGTWSRNQ